MINLRGLGSLKREIGRERQSSAGVRRSGSYDEEQSGIKRSRNNAGAAKHVSKSMDPVTEFSTRSKSGLRLGEDLTTVIPV